ncbi:tRNA-dihydrouridine synthase 2 [Entomortierella parvispora]|uniref:tRNA-dihydrouridine synthase 2 n=1 Tax=Entomortierella parvispora TaxID=205924 RepID=A0A9P3HGS2_9FUNG|nr:tRNA-dihydrouridine synthase 2 [Entomortierella parvispora]
MENYDYTNKTMLAPMVRIGTLPMRLLALEYGADLVYTPEIVDKGIVGAERIVHPDNGTVDYQVRGVSVFKTHPSEKSRLVFQIGSANAELALQAALTVKQDVSTIDLNCGCPKRFSIHGGMGAALMEEPEKLCGILRTLVQGTGLPVTCKIRIFEDRQKTLDLVKMIEKTGVKALAVHCRYRDERPRDPGHWDRFKEIVEAVSIPVIANGDVTEYSKIAQVRELTGVKGVMIARGAQSNVSVFRKEGLVPHLEIVRQYIRKAMETRNLHSNTKYVLMQIFAPDFTKDPHYRPLCDAKTFRAICQVFGMVEELDAWEASQKAQGFPYDVDTHPKRTVAPVAAAEEKVAESDASFCPPASISTTTATAKRKIDDVENAQDEKVVETKSAEVVESETKEETGPPAAKVAKTTTSDGSSSQPTPADTPQPVDLE